jgi:hypothetical protein
MAHDILISSAFKGLGYRVQAMDCRTTNHFASKRNSAIAANAIPPISPWETCLST